MVLWREGNIGLQLRLGAFVKISFLPADAELRRVWEHLQIVQVTISKRMLKDVYVGLFVNIQGHSIPTGILHILTRSTLTTSH